MCLLFCVDKFYLYRAEQIGIPRIADKKFESRNTVFDTTKQSYFNK